MTILGGNTTVPVSSVRRVPDMDAYDVTIRLSGALIAKIVCQHTTKGDSG